jgi:hypothetical protein
VHWPDDGEGEDSDDDRRKGYILRNVKQNFGEYAAKVRAAFHAGDRATLERIKKIILDKITTAFASYARPATFLTRNPGEQHTASFQPIAADTRNWYGPAVYRPTFINFPSPAHARMCHLALRRLPRDMRRMIIGYIIRGYVQHQLGQMLFIQ